MLTKRSFQKLGCILLAVCILQILSSCNDNKVASPTEVNTETTDSIKIYRLESDSIMEDALYKFRVKYSYIKVEDTVISDYTEFSKKINTELMAGEGPDVIKMYPFMFNSLYKAMNSGVFYDINSFMENDNDFIPSEYNKAVLDSGIIDGKRLYVPLGYKVPCIWTAKSILKESGLSFNMENWTWKQFAEIGKSFTESSPIGRKRYIFSEQSNIFSSLLQSGGMKFVDYKKKQSHFNSPPFIEALEIYKELYSDLTPYEVQKAYKTVYDQLKGKSLLAICGYDYISQILNPGMLWMDNSSLKHYMNEDITLYPFPTYSEGDKVMAEPLTIAAINCNSKNKKAAYNFIKILLSTEIQSTNYFMNSEGIPVNNTAIDTMVTKYSGTDGAGGIRGGGVDISGVPLPVDLVEQAKKIANNISGCEVMDQSILTFVLESVDSFIKGDITAKQAAEMIDNKVMLFLSE